MNVLAASMRLVRLNAADAAFSLVRLAKAQGLQVREAKTGIQSTLGKTPLLAALATNSHRHSPSNRNLGSNMYTSPPPVIATAKLIKFADATAPAIFTGTQAIYLGAELIGAAPRIAICQQIPDDSVILYLCDENWGVIAAVGGGDVSELTRKAELWYQGINDRWTNSPYSDEDCQKFLEDERGGARCAFCRRWDWEYSVLFSENGTNICDVCVRRFFVHLTEDGSNDDK